jgi:BirA family biotin operon repressor/biotin-[acetyl-CoA-carboxylase] ligase
MDWSGLSLAVGTSLAQSLHPKIGLKWPNDLWFEDRKLAGILIETCSIGQIRYAVVGVGINILSAEPNSSAHAPQLRRSPAWLQELLTTMNAPDALLRIVPDLVQTLQVFERQGFAPFQASFHQRDVLLNLDIAVDNIAVETQPLSGTARGVNNKGELQLESAQGLHLINCSEVSVKPL